MSRILRIGTRRSPLALIQTRHVMKELCDAHNWSQSRIEIVEFDVKGDQILDRALGDIGGKGLFTQELEVGLHNQSIDMAVHSLKDLPIDMPEGLVISTIPKRENVQDAFVSLNYAHIDELRQGAVVGTSSLRRKAQLLAYRPDLKIVPLRGNVGTRLRKLEQQKELDAIVLAVAGLKRLGLEKRVTQTLPSEIMLPAIGQGALAIETRKDDTQLQDWLLSINCEETSICVATEREFLSALDGSCHTPIAGSANKQGEKILFTGRVLSEDGQVSAQVELSGKTPDIGKEAAEQIKASHPALVQSLQS